MRGRPGRARSTSPTTADGAPAQIPSAGGGVGAEPARRVRARHRPRAVPQVVERLRLGTVGHRLRVLGGVCMSAPEPWPGDRTGSMCSSRHRHALYHKWWNGTAWGPSVTGYERWAASASATAAGGRLGREPSRRVRPRDRPRAVPQVVERLRVGTVGHRLRAHGRRLHRPAGSRGLGPEPARRVRASAPTARCTTSGGTGPPGDPRSPATSGWAASACRRPGGRLGPEPARRVRHRHRRRAVPQVVGRLGLGSLAHRLRAHGRRLRRRTRGCRGGRTGSTCS